MVKIIYFHFSCDKSFEIGKLFYGTLCIREAFIRKTGNSLVYRQGEGGGVLPPPLARFANFQWREGGNKSQSQFGIFWNPYFKNVWITKYLRPYPKEQIKTLNLPIFNVNMPKYIFLRCLSKGGLTVNLFSNSKILDLIRERGNIFQIILKLKNVWNIWNEDIF